jgi:hypothetical protein
LVFAAFFEVAFAVRPVTFGHGLGMAQYDEF